MLEARGKKRWGGVEVWRCRDWRGRDNHREPPFLSSNIHKIFHRHGRLGSDGAAPRVANERRQAEVGFQMRGRRSARGQRNGEVGEIESWLVRRRLMSHG